MGERREEGVIFRIGSVAGIGGALLAMVGNLLHPATPIGDPELVARTTVSDSRVPNRYTSASSTSGSSLRVAEKRSWGEALHLEPL